MLFQFYFYSRNKYDSESESIYDKDHVHLYGNLCISQNFIICFFIICIICLKPCSKIIEKIEKFKTYFDIQKTLTLKMSLNKICINQAEGCTL